MKTIFKPYLQSTAALLALFISGAAYADTYAPIIGPDAMGIAGGSVANPRGYSGESVNPAAFSESNHFRLSLIGGMNYGISGRYGGDMFLSLPYASLHVASSLWAFQPVDLRDSTGAILEDGEDASTSFVQTEIGGAFNIKSVFKAGVSGHILSSTVANVKGSGFSFAAGMTLRVCKVMYIGWSGYNLLNGSVKYENDAEEGISSYNRGGIYFYIPIRHAITNGQQTQTYTPRGGETTTPNTSRPTYYPGGGYPGGGYPGGTHGNGYNFDGFMGKSLSYFVQDGIDLDDLLGDEPEQTSAPADTAAPAQQSDTSSAPASTSSSVQTSPQRSTVVNEANMMTDYLTLFCDAAYYNDTETAQLFTGMEYNIGGAFAVRGGIRYIPYTQQIHGSFGVGINLKKLSLNYGMTITQLGNRHLFGLTIHI